MTTLSHAAQEVHENDLSADKLLDSECEREVKPISNNNRVIIIMIHNSNCRNDDWTESATQHSSAATSLNYTELAEERYSYIISSELATFTEVAIFTCRDVRANVHHLLHHLFLAHRISPLMSE